MKRISITVPDEVYNFIKVYSETNNRTVSNQISAILRGTMEEVKQCRQNDPSRLLQEITR